MFQSKIKESVGIIAAAVGLARILAARRSFSSSSFVGGNSHTGLIIRHHHIIFRALAKPGRAGGGFFAATTDRPRKCHGTARQFRGVAAITTSFVFFCVSSLDDLLVLGLPVLAQVIKAVLIFVGQPGTGQAVLAGPGKVGIPTVCHGGSSSSAVVTNPIELGSGVSVHRLGGAATDGSMTTFS